MKEEGGTGAAIAGVFTAIIVGYYVFMTVVAVGIVVVICVIAYCAFTLGRTYMKCNTIKHCVDREYNYKMFKIDKEYDHKNRQLQAKNDRPGQQCIDADEYSVEYKYTRRRND